jgi:DNA end-binding protein Ku
MLNPATGNRIAMQTVDSETRQPVERSETVKGYKLDDGRYVSVTDEELGDSKPESSKVLTLSNFVGRDEVDPLYVDTPYFVYPEKNGVEAYRVIAQALKNKKRVALGRIVLSQREHPVMLEPFEDGLLMCTLRSEDEVREAEFDLDTTPLDKEMVSLAESIIERMKGNWSPEKFNDAYQDAVRALIETKAKGLPAPKGTPVGPPSNVVDLMSVLKKSLAATGKGEPEMLSTKRPRSSGQAETKSSRRKKVS